MQAKRSTLCVCERCGVEFRRKRGTKGRYCGHACYHAALIGREAGGGFAARFWRMVDKNGPVPAHRPELGPCWLWIGYLNANGYGHILRGGRGSETVGAHRASWETHNGPIPDGLWVLHKCDRGNCVRPDHLELGDHALNMVQMAERARSNHGERNPFARLKAADIPVIRVEAASAVGVAVLAQRYGVRPATIRRVIHGKTWTHVA